MALRESPRLVSASKIVKYGTLLVIVLALAGELRTAKTNRSCLDGGIVTKRLVEEPSPGYTGNTVISKNSIAPGELPGYTGWARPEKTLARSFSIQSISGPTTSKRIGVKHREYAITVKCEGHEDCFAKHESNPQNGASMFFLRAYGPAVLPGTVTSRSCERSTTDIDSSAGNGGGCTYEILFDFYDSGVYTIEIVLTVSNAPAISAFPLGQESNQQEPHYEGYLLPGFPLIVTVALEEEGDLNSRVRNHGGGGNKSIRDRAHQGKELCKFQDLVETSPTSAMEKARWKVVNKVNEKEYSSKTMNSPIVSKIGYINNVNSLGINMEYRYLKNCLIISESFFDANLREKRTLPVDRCNGNEKKLHIVYIGDSVLRVQKDMLKGLMRGIPTHQVEFSFLSLHGGYRKNQILGPSIVEKFLQDLRTRVEAANAHNADNEKVVILFNTGLHDIHRLCGAEFQDERPTYLDTNQLTSETFACVDEYRALLKDFVDQIDKFPAALKVFQSTTAAWPKYGNYGIDWKQNGQGMVLVSDFCAAFNEIAFDVLADYKPKGIDIMDGYWITYPRPDNREVGDIGKKLSHPGVEVLSVMTRKWVMLILDRVCLPI